MPEKDDRIIYAPFTEEQVESLNLYQQAGWFEPFTCTLSEHHAYPHYGEGVLVAAEDGWHCPHCKFTQNWAWSWMANWKK